MRCALTANHPHCPICCTLLPEPVWRSGSDRTQPVRVKCVREKYCAWAGTAVFFEAQVIESKPDIRFAGALRHDARAVLRVAADIAKGTAVGQAEKMTAAIIRGDIKTADMLEAQVVTASKIQQAIEALIPPASLVQGERAL